MKITFLSVCLLAFLFTFSTETFAVDFTVNLTTDQHDANTGDGICDVNLATAGEQCTIRAAIEQAFGLGSNDRVLFNLPVNSTITLTEANGGNLFISGGAGALEIIGTGANNLTIDGGAGTNRIFTTFQVVVTISGVTLTGGNGVGTRVSGYGGAIYTEGGTLTLDSVHVKGNAAGSGGGAFFNAGTTRIINSTFSANTAGTCGGFIDQTNLSVANSTISGNSSSSYGGGICTQGPNTILRNVTITNNAASSAGGIFQAWGLNFGNTIVSGNTATSGNYPEIEYNGGTITSAGGNLVGDSSGDSTNTGIPIFYQPTDIRDVNPMLGALTIDNGGTTPTHALLPGSPAIDKGLNALAVDPSSGNALVFDQRGVNFPRIRDGNGDGTAIVDIGAFEFLLRPTAAAVSVAGRVRNAFGRGINRALVTMTDSRGVTRTAYTNSFGYYSFADVEVGQTVIFDVRSKRYNFTQPTQVISLDGNSSRVNFTAY